MLYFKQQLTVRVTCGKEAFDFDCRREHMLMGKRSDGRWLYYCDRYGRTGTSQVFSALRFRIEGRRLHGLLSDRGLTATALLPDGREQAAQCVAVDADQLTKKEEQAIRLLQSVARGYDGEIEVGYSGGKDSDVILHLARRAGIRIKPIYRNTTIDPPGTIAHVREVGGVEIVRPERSFFQLVEQMGMPNRFQRFCCRYLKEYKVLDKSVMGIRKAESTKRDKQYDEPTECRYYGAKTDPANHVEAIYPILGWSDEDVLNYIDRHSLRVHPLYYREDGTIDPKRRLGCMCCPMIYWKRRVVEFRQHPVMVRAYCRAAQKHRETHPDTDAAKDYRDVYELFFRNVFFDTKEKWDAYKHSIFPLTDYRQWLMDYFKVDLPRLHGAGQGQREKSETEN